MFVYIYIYIYVLKSKYCSLFNKKKIDKETCFNLAFSHVSYSSSFFFWNPDFSINLLQLHSHIIGWLDRELRSYSNRNKPFLAII